MKETNKPRLNLLVKTPIIIISIIVFVNGFNNVIDYYNSNGNNGGLIEYLNIIFNTSILRLSAIILIPLIGVFFNKKIGWLLILSFYYFWIILMIYTNISSDLERSGSLVMAFGVIVIALFFVAIMNGYENSKLVYKIKKDELLKMNISAFLIALIEMFLIFFFNYTKT